MSDDTCRDSAFDGRQFILVQMSFQDGIALMQRLESESGILKTGDQGADDMAAAQGNRHSDQVAGFWILCLTSRDTMRKH